MSTSNIEILQRFHSKVLRMITDSPWYVPNVVVHKDLHVLTVRDLSPKSMATEYSKRIQTHLNELAKDLMTYPTSQRFSLKKSISQDLI